MIGIVGLLYRHIRAAPSFKSKVPRGCDWIDGVLRLMMLGSSENSLSEKPCSTTLCCKTVVLASRPMCATWMVNAGNPFES